VVSVGVVGSSDGGPLALCLVGDLLDGQTAPLQMLDQEIESTVSRHYPKGGGQVAWREFACVEGG
jgi:hypothetical protein